MKITSIQKTNLDTNKNIIKKNNFKDFLKHKNNNNLNLQNFWYSANINHQKGLSMFKKYLNQKNVAPIKLLKIQYNLSNYLLKEQMFAKLVELSSNSVKNITQMPV